MAASMMISNAFLLIFAVAFMGCVLATPVVTRIAHWAGAIDRPDQFRRIHKGATPRLGGLGLAFGLVVGILLVTLGGYLSAWDGLGEWQAGQWPVLVAGLMVLALGFVDDTRGVGPHVKLAGQVTAILVLYFGGVRIQSFDVLGWELDFNRLVVPVDLFGYRDSVAVSSLVVTTLWFLGCMNIWNLIDGMDGLASGVGLLVSGTLTLVAIHHENVGVAVTASALAGGLAGFLLYNWHPACIFLGDSGSLLIGFLIGVIGVQGSFKGPSAISILFPILAMGLPISDTALAIFRRWVRNLPLSAADRRHVHHLLIGLGLNPRQAALLLYCFSGFLCGAVLLGVALKNEQLALVLGTSGCLAFLLVVTSRLNEFSTLRGDLSARLVRGRQERFAAKVAWEAIQRIELCGRPDEVCEILAKTTRALDCDLVQIACTFGGEPVPVLAGRDGPRLDALTDHPELPGPTAIFRLSGGEGLLLTVALHQNTEKRLAADICFRFLQRISMSTAERLERLLADRAEGEVVAAEGVGAAALGQGLGLRGERGEPAVPVGGQARWLATPGAFLAACVRLALGGQPRAVAPPPTFGEE
jgi:UDP-GlcNAc:undecaprenyl-phosphate GlcNAc-1-phosphate transferase